MKRHIAILASFILLFTLPSCGAEREPDLAGRILAGIDISADDYLEYYSQENNYSDILRLSDIHYGSFTAADKNEIFALIKIEGVPHAAGLDRTIAAVYDAETLEIITQKTFAADRVSLYFLQGYDRAIENILFIGDVTYSGFTAYSIELYTLRGGEWAEKPMPFEEGSSNSYAVTNDFALHVFKLIYEDFYPRPVYELEATYFWSVGDEEFMAELP